MNKAILTYVDKNPSITTVFTDYFDTIAHRTVHPNNIIRLWAKFMIREMGLSLSIDELFLIRKEAKSFLAKKNNVDAHKIPYENHKYEVFKRIVNTNALLADQKESFFKYFELAEIRAEQSVQFLNKEMLKTLEAFKTKNIKICLVSDYYASTNVLVALLKYHKIDQLFDHIFASSSIKTSKQAGDIYPFLLKKLSLKPEEVLMVGDNKVSDYKNSTNQGLHAYLLPHDRYLKQNRLNNYGNDAKDYRAFIDFYLKQCQKKEAEPLSQYILIFYVFIERLYVKCKVDGVKNLFFLAREGQYLKKLFDYYQDYQILFEGDRIKTHYFRTSRQASFQISFKPIDEEDFSFLKKKFKGLSINYFLKGFNFSEAIVKDIKSSYPYDYDKVITSFFESEAYKGLAKNQTFRNYYEKNRVEQKVAFEKYIASYNVDFQSEGMNLVDIGWGGTMQESLYKYFNESLKVTGYYLGLKLIYDIKPNTKRYGLIYSVYPIKKYKDDILDVNAQIYEQLLSADHGSTLGYDANSETYTVEYHQPIEKALYEKHIAKLQDYMFIVFKKLLRDSENICYEDKIVDKNLVRLSLKIGLFQTNKELKFLNFLNKSLYNNIGEFKVGITYSAKDVGGLSSFIKKFVVNPEKTFRYFTKLNTMLYNKNRVLPKLFPMFLVYGYIRMNGYVKRKILKKRFYFKYASME
ncbi:HAD family hydrolase [Winogradskyella ursingii]|uniref:HAD family hydrolase n=1 Tax=Winogradskyella ursingii TaxID=2686079 RepID=UPI0015CB8E7C|nr:HAD family hydrolase [Winogradskyella ursingii]